MENANLPTQRAQEPTETAKQIEETMLPPVNEDNKKKQNITFSGTTENPSAYKNSYKEVLSQPASGLTHRQKLLWLQKRRTVGIWAQCEDCERWRYLPNVLDNSELPNKWYCRMNADKSLADCSVPEVPLHIREEEDLIHSEYSAGSVVWARLNGWPWWPAMVDDCPDVEQFYWLDGFSDIPTHYNVVFFDSNEVTRAWVAPQQMRPYTTDKSLHKNILKTKKYMQRLRAAITQADDAARLPFLDRLSKYSFIARYKGNIASPKKVTKTELVKYQKVLKRKFNVEFPIESSSDDDEEKQDNKKKMPTAKTIPNKQTKSISISKNNKVENGIPITQSNNDSEKDVPEKTSNWEKINNEPDSTAVQVGSDVHPSFTTTATSNDGEFTTYVPETQTGRTMELSRDTEDGIASPTSDDFDFL